MSEPTTTSADGAGDLAHDVAPGDREGHAPDDREGHAPDDRDGHEAEDESTAGTQLATSPADGNGDDALVAALLSIRTRLARSVVLTVDRLQETIEEAVRNRHISRPHADQLLHWLTSTAQRQTHELQHELEHLLTRGRHELADASRRARGRASSAASERVLRQVDRARRAVGLGPSLPIADYDDLTAKQVIAQLGDLDETQLYRVRQHESKHAQRKTVLEAVDRALK